MPSAYLVPEILLRNSITLIIGGNLSGKTNLALTQLDDYCAGKGFMGYLPGDPPEQIGAIVCTGTRDDLWNVAYKPQFLTHVSDPRTFPIVKMRHEVDQTDREALEAIYAELNRWAAGPVKLLLVEDLQGLMFTRKVNDPKLVAEFMDNLRKFCIAHGVTILATVSEAKMKRGEAYKIVSHRAYGSILWGQESSCVIGIEREIGAGSLRKIEICPKAHPDHTRYANFDQNGQLRLLDRPDTASDSKESPNYAKLDARFADEAPGAEFTRETFIQWGEDIGVSSRTVERWLALRCNPELGFIEKIGNARSTTYRKPREN
jgi:hypothetical protein